MRRLLLQLLLLIGLAAAVPAPAAAAPAVGLADNKVDMFADARFKALGVRLVRLSLPWDALSDKARRAELDAWMAGARATGARPLITFDRSRSRPSYNPTSAQLVAALRGLRARYPGQVREVATWNEPNLGKRPELVAKWWLALRRACPSCQVLAAELVDVQNAVAWTRRFTKAAGREPRLWGLHNYVDVNRFTTKATAAFLEVTKGQVWLTETGGVEARRNGSGVPFAGKGRAHAARAMTFLFTKVAGLSPRITRIYVYHWNATANNHTWDSALVGPSGERPALSVLRDVLKGAVKPKKPKR